VNVCDKSGTHKETIQGTRTNTMKLSRTKHNPDSALLEDRHTRVMAKFKASTRSVAKYKMSFAYLMLVN